MSAAPVELDEPPDRAVRAVLAMGANLGARERALAGAVADLNAFEGLTVRAVSPVFETTAVGGPPQPDYLNAVVLADSSLSPLELLTVCHRVEADHGRMRTVHWGPRTLDLDLIDYAGMVATSRVLELPHPRAASRAFVLVPWLAVDPDAELPTAAGRVRVAELLARLPEQDRDEQAVRPRPDVVLEVPQ